MTVILIVEKNGTIKETNVKNLQISELYKKAGFKNSEGFEEPIVTWPRPNIDPFTLDYQIHVFGKTKGKAGQENKYDFPPPIDTTLFFGNVALVAVRPGGAVCDLTLTAWEMVYEQLFGGFEDLVDSHGRPIDDENSEDESEDLEGCEFTKEGYVKDDFIVDDDEEDGDYVENTVFRKNIANDSDEDSEFELPKTRKNKRTPKAEKTTKTTKTEKPAKAEKVSKKKSKKTSAASSSEDEREVVEVPSSDDNHPVTIEESTEEEEVVEKPSKKQRKPRVPKEPKVKEPKVKKPKEPKEPKEKSEPKKKSKRGGKKDLSEIDSDIPYFPITDTKELEEERYI